MTDSEHRKHRREAITLVVEYDGADDFVTDVTENLSEGGTFVQTDRDLGLGTQVKLVLSFPGLIEPIKIPGVVRWSRQEGPEEERGVGIEFAAKGDLLEQINTIIDRIGSGDPSLIARVVRVLVVEDNPHVARLIREGLAGGTRRAFGDDTQFNYSKAANGSYAMEILESEEFDVLVIDVYLPVMDGPSVITAIRDNERIKDLPIIAVSAGGKAARKAALDAGADFFLEKPMRLREIIESMRKLMAPT